MTTSAVLKMQGGSAYGAAEIKEFIQKRQAFWAIVRVILIIGIALGLFYYLEPYLNKIINLASSIPGVKENLNIGSVQEMFKKF